VTCDEQVLLWWVQLDLVPIRRPRLVDDFGLVDDLVISKLRLWDNLVYQTTMAIRHV